MNPERALHEKHLNAILSLRFSDEVDEASVRLVELGLEEDSLYLEHHRLLPLLNARLSDYGFNDSAAMKIKSVYRHTFYRNRILIDRAIKAQKLFEKHLGLSLLVLKGMGLAVTHYRDIGERPMSDIDLLVPGLPSDFVSKARYLSLFPGSTLIRDFPVALTMSDRQGFEYDIHRRPHVMAMDHLAPLMFKHKHDIAYSQGHISVPCDAHQLMHVLFHGLFSANDSYSKRWVVDALTLLQSEKFDTDLSIELSRYVLFPVMIKVALHELLNLPDRIVFNREAARTILNGVRPQKLWLENLCIRVPKPTYTNLKRERFTWIKEGLVFLVLVPFCFRKKLRVRDYYRNLFASQSLITCLRSFVNRAFSQFRLLFTGKQPSKS